MPASIRSMTASSASSPTGAKFPPARWPVSPGRVWSGQQAKQLLVDSLGGLEDAIKVAREVAAIPADQPSVIRIYPAPLSTFETIAAVLKGDKDIESDVGADRPGRTGRHGGARALAPLFQGPRAICGQTSDIGTVR